MTRDLIRPQDAAREVARVATVAALTEARYKFPDEFDKRLRLDQRVRPDRYIFGLCVTGEREEDWIMLTRAEVGPTFDDVTVEVFHGALAALGVPRRDGGAKHHEA